MPATTDLFIIGGGINGTGIARDAAGRVGHAGAGRDDVVPPAHLDHGAV